MAVSVNCVRMTASQEIGEDTPLLRSQTVSIQNEGMDTRFPESDPGIKHSKVTARIISKEHFKMMAEEDKFPLSTKTYCGDRWRQFYE